MCNTVAHEGMGLLVQATLSRIQEKLTSGTSLASWDTTIGNIVGSTYVDLEPLTWIILDKFGFKAPCGHFILHSLVLAPLSTVFISIVIYKIFMLKIRGLNSSKDVSFKNILYGTTIGVCTHILTDALVHTPKQQWPFWPLSTANPFYQHMFTRTDGNIIGLVTFFTFIVLTIYYFYQTKV